MNVVISYHADSLRALRAVCRTLNQTGEEFLHNNIHRIIALSSGSNSSLYSVVYQYFVNYSVRFRSEPHRFAMQFLLSIPEGIRALGIPSKDCQDKILSCQEISRFNSQVQEIQDSHLMRIWRPVHERIMMPNSSGQFPGNMMANSRVAGVPGLLAPAEVIRPWMLSNSTILQGITELDLCETRMTCVPTELGLCKELLKLDLSRNLLTCLPENVFHGMSRLKVLDLSGNQVTSLPQGLFQEVPEMRTLVLSGNRLTSLPQSLFHRLGRLQKLDLCNNRLISLPQNLFQELTMLQEVDLSYNRLTFLPRRLFHGAAALQTLYLSANHLISLPSDLFHGLNELQTLWLSGNPQLLITWEDQSFVQNNIGFREQLHTFFDYQCFSPFARFYQLAAGSTTTKTVRESFDTLHIIIKNALFMGACIEAGFCAPHDHRWGEIHLFDSMQIFGGALKNFVKETFDRLSTSRKEAVYEYVLQLAQNEDRAMGFMVPAVMDSIDPQWKKRKKVYAHENILRLIDAIGAGFLETNISIGEISMKLLA